MITHGRAVLFVGPTGTGKSVYIKDKLMNGMDKEAFQPLVSEGTRFHSGFFRLTYIIFAGNQFFSPDKSWPSSGDTKIDVAGQAI